MSYHHKSGSQKRKERAERDRKMSNVQKGQSTLTVFNFYSKEDLTKNVSIDDHLLQNDSASTKPTDNNDLPKIPVSSSVTDLINRNLNENTLNNTSVIESNTIKPVVKEPKSELHQYKNQHNYDYDIGIVDTEVLRSQIIDDIIRRGHEKLPATFPRDRLNEPFPVSLLYKMLPNGEKVNRDWLVWSRTKSSFICLPCRLFNTNNTSSLRRSYLCSPGGYSKNLVWKKLYDKLPSHENNKEHIQCYLKWREFEIRIRNDCSIDQLVCEQIAYEISKWREILTRILDTILFLGERGLALRGESHIIGKPNNGNFLGILELISHYDPILRAHLDKVKISQELHQRLQVHYLSPDIQNEFIELCARHIMSVILKEREKAKYYAIIVDATPDSAHVEQTTFILRYIHFDTNQQIYKIEERFLLFVDCNNKTGEAIADLIRETLKKFNIPLAECRGQGYDNGSNMKGQYKGAQSYILRDNSCAIYTPCAAHSLNLCGVDSAECCLKAITFFGVVQKCYNIFSSSPQRWEILKKKIPSSLHGLSDTRWSARIDAVKPFVKHLPGLQDALEDLKKLNVTAETRRDIEGILKYISKFECILIASTWYKVLSAINERNLVLQARDATIDVEITNLESLISDLQLMRNQWDYILQECRMVASVLKNTSSTLQVSRKRKRVSVSTENQYDDSTSTDEDTDFKRNTFFVILDSVIAGITDRFESIRKLNDTFSFLWNFPTLLEEEIHDAAKNFILKYKDDVSQEIETELIHLKHIYKANFTDSLSPFDLLNEITSKNLDTLFPNVCVALRIFCTLPVSVASAERSFSVLSRIKNFHRSCSTQTRVSGLATLCLESALARQIDFKTVIDSFASEKARKANLK